MKKFEYVTIKEMENILDKKALFVGNPDECFKFCEDNKLITTNGYPVQGCFYYLADKITEVKYINKETDTVLHYVEANPTWE